MILFKVGDIVRFTACEADITHLQGNWGVIVRTDSTYLVVQHIEKQRKKVITIYHKEIMLAVLTEEEIVTGLLYDLL